MIYTLFKESYRESDNQKIPNMFPNSGDIKMPAEALLAEGSEIVFTKDFFKKEYLDKIKEDDIVIVWIGLDEEKEIEILKNLKCRKFLRNIDVQKTDKILFKSELKILNRIDFEATLLCYPSLSHAEFLKSHGFNSICYPHFLDFNKNKKQFVPFENRHEIMASGQQSSSYYPVRTRLMECLGNKKNIHNYNYRLGYLHHPGWNKSKNGMSHNIIGEEYINCLSKFKMAITCGGKSDSMFMKYLEMAKAYTLPIGEKITYMPKKASDAMVCVTENDTDKDIFEKIMPILKDEKELKERILAYSSAMSENFEIKKGTKEVINRIKNKEYIC